jgi:hypothetical protein
MQAVLDAIDASAEPATSEIGTVGFGSVLAVIELAVPSFNRADHVLTMLGVPRSDISADCHWHRCSGADLKMVTV